MVPGEQYRFGPFQLDVAERELRRDGEVVALTAKTFDLLLILVQGAGRTFTKSELLDSLWPGAVVEESNLSQTIFLLRKALGENGDGSDHILTVPRRGYKFIGTVRSTDADGNREPKEAPTMPSRISWLWAAIAGLATIALATLAFVHFREVPPEAGIVRSTILLPEDTRYTDGALALSPDGRRIAFAATPKNGKSQIWIRPLDAGAAQPLEGTEGAHFPFWSPDSRWLAFLADGKLKKIDTQRGPPITLADAPTPSFGGSWSRNGMILFSPTWGTLQQISSSGGTPTPAVAAATVGKLQCCPWFLPDGEHYLFAAQVGADLRVNLLAASLNSAASKIVVEASNAAYAQGRLVYLKENTLVAQRFDVKALRTVGDPEAIAEGVGHVQNTFQEGFFTVSSTGMLAYLVAPRTFGRQLTWFDRTGKALGTIGGPRAFFDIEASPDWKRVAASVADSGNIDVWIYDLARGLPTRFTFDPAPEFRAMWSPDGRTIVFNSSRNGHADLYRKAADGSGAEELLYTDSTDKTPISWSRDGKFLLYIGGTGQQDGYLQVLSLTPERPGAPLKSQPLLATKPSLFGQFSPDGKWVAYESYTAQKPDIYVAPFSRPTEKHQISPNGGARPRWRRDGKEIFYLTPTRQLMAAEVTIKGDTVNVGAIREQVGGIEVGGEYFYDVTPDGQRILAAVGAGGQTGPTPIAVVQNWTTALKK